MPRAKTTTDAAATTATKPTLPKGWQWVRFDEIAHNVNATCTNPKEAGLDHFVGLEHLEPRDLRIRSWGNIADGTTFNRVFRTGQVLFGKRRAYQRKAAVAHFDGLCSGDIYVFAANEKRLIPELLPFIVQSEGFAKHAEDTSEGSLSPRTKWKYLAAYEFALPSDPAEQRRIADLLRAADDAVEAWRGVAKELTTATKSLQARYLPDVSETLPTGWDRAVLNDLLTDCDYGLSDALSENGPYPVLRMNNLQAGRVDMSDLKYVDLPEPEAKKYRLLRNDIVFNRTNSFELVGKVALYDSDQVCLFASYLVRLRTNARVTPQFLNMALNSSVIQRKILAYRTPGVSQCNINASNLRKVMIPVPPLTEQAEFLQTITEIEAAYQACVQHMQKANDIKQHLLFHLLTPPSETT